MRRFFRKIRTEPKPQVAPASPCAQRNYSLSELPVLNGPSLLSEIGYDERLTPLYRLVGISEGHFDQLYRTPVLRFAEAVQLVPASENNHHCGPGGLLKHTLETILFALQIRRSYQLPLGASPQTITAQEHIWTYGVFCACLMHDVGKVLGRFVINANLPDGKIIAWTPHHGDLVDTGAKTYGIEFVSMPYKAHQRLGMSLFSQLIPQSGRAWLIQHQDVMTQLIAHIWGDDHDSQIIGEIAIRADRESTARNLDITHPDTRLPGASASVADKLMRVIRQLLTDSELKANRDGAAAWVKGEYTYLVCRPVVERAIKQLSEEGVRGIPQDPIRIYDVLQEHGFALSNGENGAIHRIKVENAAFSHTFTCLKMLTRRLWVPTRLPVSFDGKIEEVLNTKKSVPNLNVTEAKNSEPNTLPEPESKETEHQAPPKPAKPLETQNKHDSEEDDPFSEPAPFSTKAPPASHSDATDQINFEPAAKSPPEPPEIVENKGAAPSVLTWEDDVGNAFFEWLKLGLLTKSLPVNNAQAGVHFVEDGVFLVSPKAFQQFCVKSGLGPKSSYNKLQKRFQRLKLNKKTRLTGMNVHTYIVKTASTTSRINGWIIPYERIYPEGAERPAINTLLIPESEAND